MTGARDITQLCCSPNFAGIVKNEQSFYSVYSYSGIESIERALNSFYTTAGCFTTPCFGERVQSQQFSHQYFCGQFSLGLKTAGWCCQFKKLRRQKRDTFSSFSTFTCNNDAFDNLVMNLYIKSHNWCFAGRM